VISGIFNEAIDIGYTEQNPAQGLLRKILPAKSKRNLTRSDPFTVQDRDRFLEAASTKLPEPYPLVLEIMAMTGLRLGEALAMSWENFDINNCQYQVTESVKLGKFGPPKSGERLVDLDAALVTKIEAYQRKMGKGKVRFSARYLFPEVSQRMIQRAMERACREARLRRRHPHDLRHTYATILLMAHISPAYVQKQLGHHSISMTVDIYGHWIPGEGRENLDKVLRPNSKPGHPFSVVRRGKE
jgi:integrase